METIGDKMSKFVTLPLLGIATAAIVAAKGAEDTAVRFNAVFADLANDAQAWAETYGAAVGREADDTMSFLAAMDQTAKATGLSADAALNLSQVAVKLGTDLAAFNGTSIEQAMDAVKMAMIGNTRGMREYGVVMDEADILQYAMATGVTNLAGKLVKSKEDLDGATKAQVALKLVIQQTTAAQDAATKQTDTMAYRLTALKTSLAEAGESIGVILMPYVKQLVTSLTAAVDWFRNLDPAVKAAIVGFAGVVAAIGPILLIVPKVIAAVKLMQVAFSVGLGPIGLIATALAGIVAVTAFLITKNQDLARSEKGVADVRAGLTKTSAETQKAIDDYTKANAALLALDPQIAVSFKQKQDLQKQQQTAYDTMTALLNKHITSLSAEQKALVTSILLKQGSTQKDIDAAFASKKFFEIQQSLAFAIENSNLALSKSGATMGKYNEAMKKVADMNDTLTKQLAAEALARKKVQDELDAEMRKRDEIAKKLAKQEQDKQDALDKLAANAKTRTDLEDQITKDLLSQTGDRIAILEDEKKRRLAALEAVKPDPKLAADFKAYEKGKADIIEYYANEQNKVIQEQIAAQQKLQSDNIAKSTDEANKARDEALARAAEIVKAAEAETNARLAFEQSISDDLLQQSGDRFAIIQDELVKRLVAYDKLKPSPGDLEATRAYETGRSKIIDFYEKATAKMKITIRKEQKAEDDKALEDLKSNWQAWLSTAASVIGSISTIISNMYQSQIDEATAAFDVETALREQAEQDIQDAYDLEKELRDQALSDEEERLNAELDALDQQRAAKRAAEELAAAEAKALADQALLDEQLRNGTITQEEYDALVAKAATEKAALDAKAADEAAYEAEKKRIRNEIKAAQLKAIEDQRLADLALENQKIADAAAEKVRVETNAANVRRIKHDEAVAAKTFAVFEAVINTASAIIKAAPNPVLMLLAGLVGAAQLAVIASQPIPALAEGGIASKRTTATIGEEGPEAVLPLTPEVLSRIGQSIALGMQAATVRAEVNQPIIMTLDGQVIGKVMTRLIDNKLILINERNLVIS